MQIRSLLEKRAVPGKIEGAIESIDSFGNLITNITTEMLAEVPRDDKTLVAAGGHETMGIYETYSDQPPMTLVAVLGSDGLLEIAIVDESAKIMLGLTAGEKVVVSW